MVQYTKKLLFNETLYRNKSLLTNLTLQLTYRCNNRCIHCCAIQPDGNNKISRGELDTDTIKKLLREACVLGCLYVTFTGGEPLLRDDFEELYIYARTLGLRIILQTNATLITSRLAKLFAQMSPAEPVRITLYGMSRETYTEAAGAAGCFDAAQKGIRNLLKYKVPIFVYYAVFPCNKHEVGKYVQWVPRVSGKYIVPVFILFFNLHCNGDKERNEQIRNVRIPPEEGVAILMNYKIKSFQAQIARSRNLIQLSGTKLFHCTAGNGGGCINPYGDFQPCYLLADRRLAYSLKHYSLREAVILSYAWSRGKKATNPVYRQRCAKCFIKFLCVQCPGHSWIEYGTLDKPVEYACAITHAKARSLGLITAHERAWQVINWRRRLQHQASKSL